MFMVLTNFGNFWTSNAYKKIIFMYLLYFKVAIITTYEEPCTKFYNFLFSEFFLPTFCKKNV